MPDDFVSRELEKHVGWTIATHAEDAHRVFEQYRLLGGSAPAVLRDLELFCFGRERSHVPGDSHQTAFNEGLRQAYLRIRALAELDIGTLNQMEATHNERSNRSPEPTRRGDRAEGLAGRFD